MLLQWIDDLAVLLYPWSDADDQDSGDDPGDESGET